jgi:hypothetical protein
MSDMNISWQGLRQLVDTHEDALMSVKKLTEEKEGFKLDIACLSLKNADLVRIADVAQKTADESKGALREAVLRNEASEEKNKQLELRIRELEAINHELTKVERLRKKLALLRNTRRRKDVSSNNPYSAGDIVVFHLDKKHYAIVLKINLRTITVKTQTGSVHCINPNKVERVVSVAHPSFRDGGYSDAPDSSTRKRGRAEEAESVLDKEDQLAVDQLFALAANKEEGSSMHSKESSGEEASNDEASGEEAIDEEGFGDEASDNQFSSESSDPSWNPEESDE